MKSIQLKTTNEEILLNGVKKDVEFSTLELIKTAVNNCPPGGFVASDMINRLRVLDAIETYEGKSEKDGVFNLEDADYENLKKYVDGTKWNILSKSIVEFVKSLSASK